MKLEVEISEEEIKASVKRSVHNAILEKSNEWRTEGHIKARVNALWPEIVDQMIVEHLKGLPTLKQKIIEQVDRKLRAQVMALMKVGK